MDAQEGGEQEEESPGQIKYQVKVIELNTVNLNNFRLILIYFRIESSEVKWLLFSLFESKVSSKF